MSDHFPSSCLKSFRIKIYLYLGKYTVAALCIVCYQCDPLKVSVSFVYLLFCCCFVFDVALFLFLCIVAFVPPFTTRKQGRASVQTTISAVSQRVCMEMALSDFGQNRGRRPVAACLLIALSLVFSEALLSPALAQRDEDVS